MRTFNLILIVLITCLLLSNTPQDRVIIKPCNNIELSKVNKNILRLDLSMPVGWIYNETIYGDSIIISYSSFENDSSITINKFPKTHTKETVLGKFDESMERISPLLKSYEKYQIQIGNNLYNARGSSINKDEQTNLLVLFLFKQNYYYQIVYEGGNYDCLIGSILNDVTF